MRHALHEQFTGVPAGALTQGRVEGGVQVPLQRWGVGEASRCGAVETAAKSIEQRAVVLGHQMYRRAMLAAPFRERGNVGSPDSARLTFIV